jgi:hypothetical protein
MTTLRPSASALLLGVALCALSCGSKGIVEQVCPTSPQRNATSSAMTAAEFCEVFMQTCTGSKAPPVSYITQAECEAAFTGLMFESTRECRSYHVCNSAAYDTSQGLLHCGHAVGVNGCTDTGP